LEVKFTALFPTQPPVIRLIRPRLEYLTGNVTFGGTFCNDLLTNWKGQSMENLLTSLRQSLIDDGARVDLRTANL
jgi:ubiquitin-conjugating enzyme E2 Q